MEVEVRGRVLDRNRRPPRVSIQQEQWLVVTLDTTGNYVFPLWADLQDKQTTTTLEDVNIAR